MLNLYTTIGLVLLLYAFVIQPPTLAANAQMPDMSGENMHHPQPGTQDGSGQTTFEEEMQKPSTNETEMMPTTDNITTTTTANMSNVTTTMPPEFGNASDQTLLPQEPLIADFLLYDNPRLGFSIVYPSDWNVENKFAGEGTVRFISHLQNEQDLYSETVDVYVTEPGMITYYPSENTPLQQVHDGLIEFLQASNDFQLLNSSETTLGGLPAISIEYTYSDNVIGSTNVHEVFTISDGTLYEIVYSSKPESFDMQLQTAQIMMESFQTSLPETGSTNATSTQA